jgi:hypothetical protein
MTPETYDVYFSGATLKETDLSEVKSKIGAIFKLEGKKLDRLFSGKPIPIKRGVDMDRAVKFRVTFRDAGALVDIVPAGQPAPDPAARPKPPQRPATPVTAKPQSPPPVEHPAQPNESGLSLADSPLPAAAEAQVDPITTPSYELSAPKAFNLSDCAPPTESAPIPDISALHLEKAGSIIDDSPKPEALEIDTDNLELDAPGTTLVEQEEVSAARIDTTQLTLSAPNEGTLEAFQKPVESNPLPSTDHLKMEEQEEKPKSQGKAKFIIAED